MGNELANSTVFGGKITVRDVKSLAARAKAAAQNTPRAGAPDGSLYMNFSGKRGIYTVGADKRVIQNDELWLVNVESFEQGYIAWKGGRPAGKRMVSIYDTVQIAQPNDDEGGPFKLDDGEGWFQAKAMVLRSLDNEEQAYFAINSVSGVDTIAKFFEQFADRAAAGEPAWPVITLDAEEFTSQGYKNFKPKFGEVAWLSDEQMNELASGKSIEEIIDLPEAEPVKPPPVVNRRRRAS